MRNRKNNFTFMHNVISAWLRPLVGAMIVLTFSASMAAAQYIDLTWTKEFIDDPTIAGDTVTLRYTITTPQDQELYAEFEFSDPLNTDVASGFVPSGTTPDTDTCETGGATTITTSGLTYKGAIDTLGFDNPPYDSCYIEYILTVPVGTSDGDYPSTTSTLYSVDTDLGTGSEADGITAAVSDTLVVDSAVLDFSKSFTNSPVVVGDTATLQFDITNDGSTTVTGIGFTDDLDAMLSGATGVLASSTCGGSFSPGSTLALSSVSLAASASCTITVDVSFPDSTSAADYSNTTGTLTGTVGALAVNGGTASDTLTVSAAPVPTFTKAFGGTIVQGDSTTLTLTIDNASSLVAATSLVFSDDFPTGMTVAATPNASDDCGGTLTAVAGASLVSYTGGTVAAGDSCAISVAVTSATAGDAVNTTGSLSSSLGDSGTATDTLTVTEDNSSQVTIVQQADVDGTFSFTSTEALLNFDITTSSGTGQEGPISLDAGTYTLSQSRPTGVGNDSLTCDDANSSGDAATGDLTLVLEVGETVICTYSSLDSSSTTTEIINEFLNRRIDLILSNEPNKERRIDRLRNGRGRTETLRFAQGDIGSLLPFNFDWSSLGSGNYSFSGSLSEARSAVARLDLAQDGIMDSTTTISQGDFDVWFEGNHTRFDASAGTDGHFTIAYLGADYLVSDKLLLGALIQVDDISESSSVNNNSISGTGWMIGPYMTAQIAPNLYFDGRIAAGRSSNLISPYNTYTDSFSTSRWLVNASLTGAFEMGDWTTQPGISLSYMKENQQAYTDSLGVTIASQNVDVGQLRFGPNFSRQYIASDGITYQPHFTLDGIYNFGDGVILATSSSSDLSGWRARIEGGVRIIAPNGSRVEVTVSYDGIGNSDFRAVGGQFLISIPLN